MLGFLRTPFLISVVVGLAAIITGPFVERTMESRILYHRVENFYRENAPDQAKNLESIISKYAGKEEELLHKLQSKYEKSVPEVDLWSMGDPMGTAAFLAYRAAKEYAAQALKAADKQFPDVRKALKRAEDRFERSRAAIANLLSPPAQLVALGGVYFIASSRLRGTARAVLLVALALIAAYGVQPTIETCSSEQLSSGFMEVVMKASEAFAEASSQTKYACVVAAGAVGALTVLKEHRGFAFLAVSLALLTMSRPTLPENVSALDLAQELSILDRKTVTVFANSDGSVMNIYDLGICAVLAMAPDSNHLNSPWNSAILAMGVGERWIPLAQLEAEHKSNKVTIQLNGPGVPVGFIPSVAFVVVFVHAMLTALI